MNKLSIAVAALLGISAINVGHRHHHRHHHHHNSPVPACNSDDFHDCIKNARSAE